MRALYALLLFLYPASFRRRFRDELLAAFDDERAVATPIQVWRGVLPDLVWTAARLRARQIRAAVRQWTGRGTPSLAPPSRRPLMETLLQDVRYACRQFIRRPGFAAVGVISLALAIGGNSLMFGLLDGYVFHPFPYPDPDRVVAVGVTFPRVSSDTTYVETISPAEYADIRTSGSFAHVAAFDLGNRNLSGGDVPERLFTAFLLDDLFPVVGMAPALGRGFTREELAPQGPAVAIISHRVWQSRFGGDPGVIGRSIRISGRASTIVGVMPPGLLVIGTDLWIPWGADTAQMPRTARQFTVIGRLAPDATLATANVELAALASQVDQAHRATHKEYEGWRLTATPWAVALLQDVRPAAYVLLGVVGLVVLIACANLANLLLARATSRQREMAVRLALGAARFRIARQLLTESLLLSFAGAAFGLVIAYVGMQSAGSLIPPQVATLDLQATLNWRVLAWSAAVATVAGLLVAIVPAFQAARTDPHESLKADGRSGQAKGGRRLRHALVVAEIAMSVVLLLGAGLLLRTFLNLQRADLGFEPRGVLTMRLTLPQQKYPTGEAITTFFEQLVERVRAVPGVTAAGMTSQLPTLPISTAQIEVEGMAASGAMLATANTVVVSRDYFTTIGVPLARGRLFGPEDRAGGPPQIIVNETFVARYMDGRDPIGSRVRMVGRGGAGPWAAIVGVVGDARNNGVAAPVRPEVAIPMEQDRDAWNQLFLTVRAAGDPSALLPSIRAAVAALDPEQPVYAIQTLDEVVAASAFTQRVSAQLVSIFAALALVLAGVGIYGVMSYAVSARTQEIGVRMAVGAERVDVLGLIFRQVARLVVTGLALGIGALLLAARPLSSLLYGVTPTDPVTIVLVAVTLGLVALAAALGPAWRATRVDPLHALRYE